VFGDGPDRQPGRSKTGEAGHESEVGWTVRCRQPRLCRVEPDRGRDGFLALLLLTLGGCSGESPAACALLSREVTGSSRRSIKMSRGADRLDTVWVWLLLGASVVFAVVLIAVSDALNESRAALGLEAAKIGIQLLAIVIVGGAATAGFRRLESKRDDRRRRNDFRLALLLELIEAYNRIKKVRRSLRSYGFRPNSPGARPASPDQIAAFRAQMDSLLDAQLSLERIGRQVKAQRPVFDPEDGKVVKAIGEAESYVNKVVEDWENYGDAIAAGGTEGQAWRDAVRLRLFLASVWSGGGTFKELSKPVEHIEEVIEGQLLARQ